MWSVIYSLNPFSISITKDTFEHLKTREPKQGCHSQLSPMAGSAHGRPSPTPGAAEPSPKHLRGAQPSPTQHHPCRYWQWRAAFPGHPSPPLHSTQPWISTRNSLCYVSRWNWAQPSPEVTGTSLGDLCSPSHSLRQSPVFEKGPWSPVPPSKRSLPSSPEYNHSIFVCFNSDCPQHHILDKACFIPLLTFHKEPGSNNWGSLKRCNGGSQTKPPPQMSLDMSH